MMQKAYIAYKYSKVEDKNSLKEELLEVSKILKSLGHATFILGRDVQNWNNRVHPIHSKMKRMVAEIKDSECVFAYLNSNVNSFGLLFELHIAKLFGKRIVIASKKGIKVSYLKLLASTHVVFEDFSDLREQLKLCNTA
jgi:hypothetical protein